MSQHVRGTRPALVEYFQWEAQSWVQGISGEEKTYFMPIEKAKAYFTANGSKELSKILIELFNSNLPPVDPDLILRTHTAIFCILLRIGQGKWIDYFARYEELSDRRLPFDATHPPIEFPNEDPTLLQKFCEKQWMYCVPIFDDRMLHRHFGPQRLLPITYKEFYGVERMAEKYVIRLYGSNNKLLRRSSDTSRDKVDANTFTLKRYPSKESRAQYEEEVNGFRSVRNVDSIIKFYGSFSHGDECNILLEYADRGSLEEYFKNEQPPSRAIDIIKFWASLFQLIKGLKAIHSVREGHLDVNPDSVVVLSHGSETSSDWEFKFASYGVYNTAGQLTNKSPALSSYAPPESLIQHNSNGYMGNFGKEPWSADIWSIGCIYSEAAMWIADGYTGLQDYRAQRAVETETTFFKGGDCFHDGERVLQSVHDAHRDIEDRLRRADYITKDVLDSMVEEMLWEEDRPTAKALARKADMVSARARQRLSAVAGDDFPRPESRLRRMLPPRPPQPNIPLPPIPTRLRPALNSIAEQQYTPNVEKWRAQVPISPPTMVQRGPRSEVNSLPSRQFSSSESIMSDQDRDFGSSVASWQVNDNNSLASPITPFTSPRVSVNYDFQKNEGRPRTLRSQPSYENYRRPPNKAFTTLGIAEHHYSDTTSVAAPPTEQSTEDYRPEMFPRPLQLAESPKIGAPDIDQVQPAPMEVTKVPSRASSVAGSRTGSKTGSKAESRRSSVYSIPVNTLKEETKQEIENQPKKRGGFTLFPARTRLNLGPQPELVRPNTSHTIKNIPASNDAVSIRPSLPSLSNSAGIISPIADGESSASLEYLSMNTCMEWKKAHKKVKKHSKVPPLPGAHMLKGLNDRDHIFIIDDSASMEPQWADVKRVFETLSYVVKGMSPEGTELFFTISYDTYRRKDTSDLVLYMEAKTTGGETDINYRLNLQLQAYQARLYRARGQKGKKAIVRPMSFYILTNGEWGKGPNPKKTISEMVAVLKQMGCPKEQIAISFISFATDATGMSKLNDLDRTDFGMDIVDVTRWTGNVLKMLRGPMDKSVFADESPGASELDATSTTTN
ncbi:hypothetical protein B7463_g12025, partial [Scytalidium lignicola]